MWMLPCISEVDAPLDSTLMRHSQQLPVEPAVLRSEPTVEFGGLVGGQL